MEVRVLSWAPKFFMKKFVLIIAIVLLLYVIYRLLGYFEIIPTRHCDVAMGPNGVVHFCEWYKGPQRVY